MAQSTNTPDNEGSTLVFDVLHDAACQGHTEMVRALVQECGDDMNTSDNEGSTAARKAAFYGTNPGMSCTCYLPSSSFLLFEIPRPQSPRA